jgi:CBS domain-containing protein
MLKAKDIMTKELITISPDTEVSRAAAILLDKHINGLPVVDKKGRLVGILCQSDLVAQQKRMPVPSVFTILDTLIPLNSSRNFEKEIKKIAATTVEEAMTKNPITVDPEATLEVVATLMVEKSFHTIPVVEGGKLVGVIGKEDVLRTLMPSSRQES